MFLYSYTYAADIKVHVSTSIYIPTYFASYIEVTVLVHILPLTL